MIHFSLKIFKRSSRNRGDVVITTLVFLGVFMMMFAGLVNLLLLQNKVQSSKENKSQAFEAAEAGLNYYSWFLAHFPTDIQDGTGHAGTYEHSYNDAYGNPIGKFSLAIAGSSQCSALNSVTITSTGWTNQNPDLTASVTGKYTKPTIADYAYITSQNIWFGPGENVYGPLHSNGGIRMDGYNDSLVNAQPSTWTCPVNLGCSPATTKPGVFGTGTGSSWWLFPSFNFDFTGISLDFGTLRDKATSAGSYLGKVTSISGYSTAVGYHLVFNSNGTINVYIVKTTTCNTGYNYDSGGTWTTYNNCFNISTEVAHPTMPVITLPSGCGLLYSESPLWIEGTVHGKMTVVSGDSYNTAATNTIVLKNSVLYSSSDGTDGLFAMSQGDIAIPATSPDIFSLSGLFMSVNGKFGTDYYPGNLKTSLTLHGSEVNKQTGTNSWESGGVTVSGYRTSNNYFDRGMMDMPAPLTPVTGAWGVTRWDSNQ